MSKIHILGASGSGTTTFAKTISLKYKYFHMDTDNYFWKNTQIPFTEKREVSERLKMMKRDLNKYANVVSSGIFYPWGDELKQYFDYVICLDTDSEIRKKRLIEREWRMFGNRMLVGGDMHEQFNRFLKWALNYDLNVNEDISREKTDKWLKKVPGKVIILDGSLPIDENLKEIFKLIPEFIDIGGIEDDYII